jgi:Tol biopolymer transport system component
MNLDTRVVEALEDTHSATSVDPGEGLTRLRRTHARRRTGLAVTCVLAAVVVAATISWGLSRPNAATEPANSDDLVGNGVLLAWTPGGLREVGGHLQHLPGILSSTPGGSWFDDDPALGFSADGSRLFYVSDEHVRALDLGSGEEQVLAPCPPADPEGVPCRPGVSPDGSTVAFAVGTTLRIHAADGETVVELPGSPMSAPVWSRDGGRLALTLGRVEDSGLVDSSLYVVDADGTDPHRAALRQEDAAALLSRVSWAPDGGSLAYVDAWNLGDGRIRFGIRTVDLVTGRVDSLAGGGTCVTCSGVNPAVVWSPDGRQIAFSSYGGRLRSVPARADGAEPALVSVGYGTSMAWQPVVD